MRGSKPEYPEKKPRHTYRQAQATEWTGRQAGRQAREREAGRQAGNLVCRQAGRQAGK